MADNTTLNTGSGGDVVRTIDRTTSKTQVVALDFGGEAGPESLVSGTNGLPIKGLAGEAHLGAVGGNTVIASANFTRPADAVAYSINDMVANSTTAASVVPMSFTVARINAGTFSIIRARLSTTHTGLSGSENFRLYLFQSSPTISSGDNAQMSVAGRAAGFIGAFEITMGQVFNDGAKGAAGPVAGSQVIGAAAGGSQVIYGVLQALNAYTPVSGETFTVELEVVQD